MNFSSKFYLSGPTILVSPEVMIKIATAIVNSNEMDFESASLPEPLLSFGTNFSLCRIAIARMLVTRNILTRRVCPYMELNNPSKLPTN